MGEKQPAQAQAAEDQLCDGEYAQVHGPIHEQNRWRGKAERHRSTHLPMVASIIGIFEEIYKKEKSLRKQIKSTLTIENMDKSGLNYEGCAEICAESDLGRWMGALAEDGKRRKQIANIFQKSI